MKKLTYLLFLFVLAQCTTESNTSVSKEMAVDEKIKLTPDDLFVSDKVKLFLAQNNAISQASTIAFLSGLDHFKNKKAFDSAEFYFEKSLLEHPAAKTYYELGNLYLSSKKYDKALEAYQLAEKLNYEPFSKLLYNKGCVDAQQEEYDLAAQHIEYAVQAGYSNIDHIYKDSDLKKLRTEREYLFNRHLKRALRGISNSENLFWLQFKKQFASTKLPLNLDNSQKKMKLTEENYISYDYERYIAEMRDNKFSREVSQGFYYFAQIADNNEFVALIYIIKEEFLGDEAPLTYRLVTFDHTGKIIDKKEIAGRTDFSAPLKMCKISSDLGLEITSYETKFKNDPDEHGYYENPIVSKTKIKTEAFKISSSGKIISAEISDVVTSI